MNYALLIIVLAIGLYSGLTAFSPKQLRYLASRFLLRAQFLEAMEEARSTFRRSLPEREFATRRICGVEDTILVEFERTNH